MKSSHYTPSQLYGLLEAQLSPLLRECLAQALPHLIGENWWMSAVLPALSNVQRNNVQNQETLEQFDYPALVGIFLHSGNALRAYLGIGNEINNYLITIKTFRNDVQHRANLAIDADREKIIIEAALLIARLLRADEARTAALQSIQREAFPPASRRYTRSFLVGVLLVAVTSLGLLLMYRLGGTLPGSETFWRDLHYGKTAIECEKMRYALTLAESYRAVVPAELFQQERQYLAHRCASSQAGKGITLTERERHEITLEADRRVTEFWRNRSQ